MTFNPAIGRWLTEDPIDFDGGDSNLDRYCANDPVNRTDPSGLAAPGRRTGDVRDGDFVTGAVLKAHPDKVEQLLDDMRDTARKIHPSEVPWLVELSEHELIIIGLPRKWDPRIHSIATDLLRQKGSDDAIIAYLKKPNPAPLPCAEAMKVLPLIDDLDDDEHDTRSKAQQALLRMGNAVAPLLREQLALEKRQASPRLDVVERIPVVLAKLRVSMTEQQRLVLSWVDKDARPNSRLEILRGVSSGQPNDELTQLAQMLLAKKEK